MKSAFPKTETRRQRMDRDTRFNPALGTTRRDWLAACTGAAAVLALPARAQAFPAKPVRIIVPWPAGGATDLASRSFAQHLGKRLSTTVTIDNRPGATGLLGSGAAATSPADGYTLLLASAETHAINPYTFPKLPYDPVKDFIPLGGFATNPYSLVSGEKLAARTTREVVELARRDPGALTYGSAGTGSASQIVMEMFKAAESMDIRHIPYQGEAPALTALLGGTIDLMILPVGRAMALRGKVKVYSVTQPSRFEGMPDVPTMSEEGFKSIAIANWFALMAPAGTPDAIVKTLSDAVVDAAQQADTRADLAKIGIGPFPRMSQPEFTAFVGSERDRWRTTIERAKIRAGQ